MARERNNNRRRVDEGKERAGGEGEWVKVRREREYVKTAEGRRMGEDKTDGRKRMGEDKT